MSYQYFVIPPSAAITASNLFGTLKQSLFANSRSNFSHSSSNACVRASSFLGWTFLLRILLRNMCQRFSIGLRSGELEGHEPGPQPIHPPSSNCFLLALAAF